MGDNPRKVEAVIKGVTADRKQLILSIGNVEMTATRNFLPVCLRLLTFVALWGNQTKK